MRIGRLGRVLLDQADEDELKPFVDDGAADGDGDDDAAAAAEGGERGGAKGGEKGMGKGQREGEEAALPESLQRLKRLLAM